MRKIILGLALAATIAATSCTTMERVGHVVCESQGKISEGVSTVGDFFGAPGALVAGGLNIALEAFCRISDMVLSAPKDATDDITGLFTDDDADDGGLPPGAVIPESEPPPVK